MSPDKRFVTFKKNFWAYVKAISQEVGYTDRTTQTIKIPTAKEIMQTLTKLSLNHHFVVQNNGDLTKFGQNLVDYFDFRATCLNDYVKPRLMRASEAEELFTKMHTDLKPTCPLPMNKQKGTMRKPAYLTCIVNMLIEKAIEGKSCDYDPKRLVTFVKDKDLCYTMSRRVDGAYPSTVNPKAIWEVKEYYYTTTFGSRIADGVYETLLDGFELIDGENLLGESTMHLLIVDAYETWWELGGKSYLCRLIDILHMGYVDEILFGREVTERLPKIAGAW